MNPQGWLDATLSLLRTLPQGVVVCDSAGTFTFANEAAADILGISVERLLSASTGSTGLRVFDESGRELSPEEIPTQCALATGHHQPERLLRLERVDGESRWLETTAGVLRGDGDEMLAVVASFRDVTARRQAERRVAFQARLLDAVGQAVIASDPAGTVLYWNRAAEELYGHSSAHAVGRSISELVLDEATEEQGAAIMAAVRAGMSWCGEFPVRRHDGSVFTAFVTDTPVLDDAGEVEAIIGVSHDVTERRRAEKAAQALSAIVASTADAVVTLNPAGVIQTWNPAAVRLYGWTAQEATGRHVAFIVPDERLDEAEYLLAQVRAGRAVSNVDTVRRRRDGSEVEVSLTASPILDAEGVVVAASCIARDITERRVMEQALDEATLQDPVTGLPNRALLADRLEQAARSCERDDQPLSLLFVDLDGFKDVNDSAGHLFGDTVLLHVADRLVATVRPGDTVARFGGDEFVVVLGGAGRDDARHIAESVRDALVEPFEVDGRRLYLTATVGAATSPPVAPEELMRAADAAMYDAKGRGRGQVGEYVGELSQRAEDRLHLAGALREAVATHGLRLIYQPVVELASGAVLGAEALLRWTHPEQGEIPPGRFVPVAEQTGLAGTLDEWVLRHASREFQSLRTSGDVAPGCYLSINIAAANVTDRDLPSLVRSALAESGLPPTHLVLEVTETAVVADLETAVTVLSELRELGVRIAIDDFGTGWSSLTYVRRLPASILKLDQTFVADVDCEPDSRAIAASVADLALGTGMTLVAEGVERFEQLDVLRRLRFHAGQGYLWQRGVPAAELGAAVERCAAVPVIPSQRRGARVQPQLHEVTDEHGLARIHELHRLGASPTSIAAALNREGFRTPTGQNWHRRRVGQLLEKSSSQSQ